MIKRDVITIEENGTKSEHVFYSNEESNNLVLFFPGGNSNTTGPIFYYLRDYFLRNGYDVLNLSYKGLAERTESYEVKMKKITLGIHHAILHVRGLKKYTKTIFVSRSFGNIISTTLKLDYNHDVDKDIYISPIPQALTEIKKNPGLIITSNHDEYLEKEHKDDILLYQNHEVIVFKEGDHSLECEDTVKTIEFCKKAISKSIDFIEK